MWKHFAHESFNGGVDQQSTTFFGLITTLLSLHAFLGLFQVKLLFTCFEACTGFQFLLFELAQFQFNRGKLLFQSRAVLRCVLTYERPDRGDISERIGFGGWPVALSKHHGDTFMGLLNLVLTCIDFSPRSDLLFVKILEFLQNGRLVRFLYFTIATSMQAL